MSDCVIKNELLKKDKENNKRDYKKLEEEIALKGFFSEYLPPCFKLNRKVLLNPPSADCDLVAPICFSMSRFNKSNGRRDIFIPEIGSYLVLYNYIKEKGILKELIEFSERSQASFSPILSADNSIMTHEQAYNRNPSLNLEEDDVSLYIQNICKKLLRATGANKILKLDISNCYSSLYVHLIPSIILGYEKAKEEYIKSQVPDAVNDPAYTKYSELDRIIRRQNFNQTNGLLVGTLYSRIIVESILCRIDEELVEKEINYSRYVDDYEVYIENNDENNVLTTFESTLKKYGFALNTEKTETVDFPFYVIDNLQKIFVDGSKEPLDSASLMNLFNTFLTMEQQGTKGAVRFLLKSIESKPIETKDAKLYKSYLISILSNDERSLVKACSLLINTSIFTLDEQDKELIKKRIQQFLKDGYDLEAIWLVYLLVQTNSFDDIKLLELVCDSSNELAQTMLLCQGMLPDSCVNIIKQKAKSWLLNYELYVANHITEDEFKNRGALNKNLDLYNRFKAKGIHFLEFGNKTDI